MSVAEHIIKVPGLTDLNRLLDFAGSLAPLPGRVLLSAIFLWSGYGKITGWEGTAGYMASKEMPLIPFFLVMAMMFEILGGLSVLLGFKARIGAWALIGFLVPTTLIFHNFWAVPADQVMLQTIMFMKNAGIIGGLLMVASLGAGGWSLDRLLEDRWEPNK